MAAPAWHDDYHTSASRSSTTHNQWVPSALVPTLPAKEDPIAANSKYMRVGKRGNDCTSSTSSTAPDSPGSNMPAYPWLLEKETDVKSLPARSPRSGKSASRGPRSTSMKSATMAETQAQEIAASLVAAKGFPT